MMDSTTQFPTTTLKFLLDNTELADLLFNTFPFNEEETNLKSDKQLLSNELHTEVGWNSSGFLGANLWDKHQLYSAAENDLNVPLTNLHNEKNPNFTVENIDIDEFLGENNLELNDIESLSNQFENFEQATSNSPADDSNSRKSSSLSRKYSQADRGHKPKKSRKAQLSSKRSDKMKDEKYWSRRKKNNLAAKRSRDARRMKEDQIALRADLLERESNQLRKQVEDLKKENEKLRLK